MILGQDPYHGPGQAEGLAFSVAPGVQLPPSLRNIFKELAARPRRAPRRPSGSLVRWAERGVLLLNTCLTVEDGQPASHAQQGLGGADRCPDRPGGGDRASPCVYMLWGAHAQAKAGADRRTAARMGARRWCCGQPSVAAVGARGRRCPSSAAATSARRSDWLAERGPSGRRLAALTAGCSSSWSPSQTVLYFEVRRRGGRVVNGSRL